MIGEVVDVPADDESLDLSRSPFQFDRDEDLLPSRELFHQVYEGRFDTLRELSLQYLEERVSSEFLDQHPEFAAVLREGLAGAPEKLLGELVQVPTAEHLDGLYRDPDVRSSFLRLQELELYLTRIGEFPLSEACSNQKGGKRKSVEGYLADYLPFMEDQVDEMPLLRGLIDEFGRLAIAAEAGWPMPEDRKLEDVEFEIADLLILQQERIERRIFSSSSVTNSADPPGNVVDWAAINDLYYELIPYFAREM